MSKSYLLIALAVAFLAGCGKKEAAVVRQQEAPPVRAAAIRVAARSFAATVAITGTLVSNSSVTVKAETTGKIMRFAKEEGDPVRAGEPVIWVDNSKQKISLRQAQSAVQVAEAAFDRAKIMEAHSRSEYERAQNLLKSGGITDKDYKAAALAGKDSSAQVELAAAQLEQARSQVEHAKKLLSDTVITSPVVGEIQAKLVNPGGYVEPPTPVFTIVDNGRLELEAMVATSDLAPIRSGQKVAFTVNAYPDRKFEGSVIEVNPAVQAETRSAKVRVRVENSGRLLKAGMFAQGEILTGVEASAIIIPSAAIYRDDRSARTSSVFVVENGRAVRRTVQIGRERDTMVEIAQGLKPGDIVVAEQSIEVAEGVRVAAQLTGTEKSER